MVSQIPNTKPICGAEAFEAPNSCTSDGVGKGLNLQFNCETYNLCNTFFFGNSGGDLYPANYTLSLMLDNKLKNTAVFIHNNPSICKTLRPIYNESFGGNVPCYDITEPADEFSMPLMITPENITAFLASYDKFYAQLNPSSDQDSAAETFFADSKWAFFLYGALGLGALQAAIYLTDKKMHYMQSTKDHITACCSTLFSGQSESSSGPDSRSLLDLSA